MKHVFFIFFYSCLLWSKEWAPIPLTEPGHEWMDAAIEMDFANFESGISRSLIEQNWNVLKTDNNFQRFKIIGSKIYGPKGQIRNLLKAMVKHYPMPDIDFIWYNWDCVRDLPNSQNFAPIFVSAKRTDQKECVLFVDWFYDIEGNLPMSWNKIIALFDTQGDQPAWSNKIEKLFWRGSGTDGFYAINNYAKNPRAKLVLLSKKNPTIDAAFVTPGPFGKTLPPWTYAFRLTPHVPLIDHLKYKYQLIIDGLTCTYPGTQWRLYSGCLSFKQESDNIMWFFGELQPYVHYIPVHNDMSNLVAQVDWAIQNDAEAQQIANQAKLFAATHLMPEHILLYCYKALLKYASLQTFQPVAD